MILASEEGTIPSIESGDVLRISNMRIEKTSSGYDGRVYRYTGAILFVVNCF